MINSRYLIIGCGPRCGRTLCHRILKGYPEIAAPNFEISIVPLFTKGISEFTLGEKVYEISKLYNSICSITKEEEYTTVGAKTVCARTNNARILVQALRKEFQDINIILVIRRDLVAQYGSGIRANKTGLYHSTQKDFKTLKEKKCI